MSSFTVPPPAPERSTKQRMTKRARAEEDDEADDGPVPIHGGVAKLRCSPPTSDDEVHVLRITAKPQPTLVKPVAKSPSRPKPAVIRRVDSIDDPWMEYAVPATEMQGKPID